MLAVGVLHALESQSAVQIFIVAPLGGQHTRFAAQDAEVEP